MTNPFHFALTSICHISGTADSAFESPTGAIIPFSLSVLLNELSHRPVGRDVGSMHDGDRQIRTSWPPQISVLLPLTHALDNRLSFDPHRSTTRIMAFNNHSYWLTGILLIISTDFRLFRELVLVRCVDQAQGRTTGLFQKFVWL